MPSLVSEDPEHIPVERNMLANLGGWEILACISDERVDRAIELIVSTVPVQTIVPAFIADQFLGELLWDFTYARAMASYALLGALAGFRYSAAQRTLWFGPQLSVRPFKTFFARLQVLARLCSMPEISAFECLRANCCSKSSC